MKDTPPRLALSDDCQLTDAKLKKKWKGRSSKRLRGLEAKERKLVKHADKLKGCTNKDGGDAVRNKRRLEKDWAMKTIVRDVIAEKCQLPQVGATCKDATDLGFEFSPAVHEIISKWRADECTRTLQYLR